MLDQVKTTIKYSNTKAALIRENKEFLSIIPFEINKDTESEYNLKDNNVDIYIDIHTNYIKITDNILEIKYIVLNTKTEYIYRIEVNELNGNK